MPTKAQYTEAKFQAKVVAFLKTLPCCWHVKIADRFKSGIPDLLISLRGRFIAIELKKSDKEKPTKLQSYTLDQIHRSGAFTIVCNPENWIQTKACLEMVSLMPIPICMDELCETPKDEKANHDKAYLASIKRAPFY